jgi:hypothetical protein
MNEIHTVFISFHIYEMYYGIINVSETIKKNLEIQINIKTHPQPENLWSMLY